MPQSNVRLIKCLAYSFVEESSKKVKQSGGYCSLYVSADKLIIAPVKIPLLLDMIPIWSLVLRQAAFKKAEKNLNLPFDSILQEDNANYQILNNSVRKIGLKKGNKLMGGPRITVQAEDGKHSFGVTTWEVDKQDAIVDDLKKIFGERFAVEG